MLCSRCMYCGRSKMRDRSANEARNASVQQTKLVLPMTGASCPLKGCKSPDEGTTDPFCLVTASKRETGTRPFLYHPQEQGL